MYIDSPEVVENPLRGPIVRMHAGRTFPLTSLGAGVMGVLVFTAGRAAWDAPHVLFLLVVSLAIGGALALVGAAVDTWHAPAIVRFDGTTVRYSALRWALFFPKRLTLELPRSRVDHVGNPRWGGAAPVTGIATIRDSPNLEGRPFRDQVYFSQEILLRLGLQPGARYRSAG